MAVRQYIGARYVTKIYENSLDPSSAEWEASVNYEPLTLVTYNNGSYLSKKTVPASVGDPASNPSYWVQTGFYNGQIASLQSQIDTINNIIIPGIQGDIDTLNNTTIPAIQNAITALNNANWLHGKKIYVFGDSLSNLSSLGQECMWDKLLDIYPDLDITIIATPGWTMTQIATAIASATLSDADIVFIQGGTNDWTTEGSIATTYTSCKNAINKVIENSANGTQIITIAPPFSYYDGFTNFTNSVNARIRDYCSAIKMASQEYCVPCIDLYKLSSCNADNYANKMHQSGGSSYVHPNDDFATEIAHLIINQSFDNACLPLIGNLTVGSNGTSSTAKIGIDPDSGAIIASGTFIVSTSIAANADIGSMDLPVGTINSSIVHGNVAAPLTVQFFNVTQVKNMTARLNYTATSSSLTLLGDTIAANDQIMF